MRNVGIFSGGDLAAALDHGYRRSEAAQGLREFEANVSSTQHDHVFRQTVEIESFDVSHGFCGRKARNIRHGGARSKVKKDPITRDRPAASVVKVHLNRLRSHEPGFSSNQFRSGRLEAIEMKLNLALHHLSLAVQDALHIRRHWSSLDAVFRAVTSEPIRFRAANHVLAGQARNVRTRSADVFPLHDGRAVARLRHIPRQVLSGLSTSDNKDFDSVLSQASSTSVYLKWQCARHRRRVLPHE